MFRNFFLSICDFTRTLYIIALFQFAINIADLDKIASSKHKMGHRLKS